MKTKTKRIKRVFSSSQEVFHMWAAQTQDDGRQGGRITRAYFDGTSCYSYGSHYELGRLVEINGIQVALINTSGYSNTTAKHISEARGAVSHLPQIDVDHLFDWKQGLLNMQAYLVNGMFNLLNRRTFWNDYSVKENYQFSGFNNLCKLVGMSDLQLYPDKDTIDMLQAHVDKCIAREAELKAYRLTPEYQAKKQAENIRKEEKRQEKVKAEIEAWKQGGTLTFNVSKCHPQLIRIKDGMVETSNHARVELGEALNALGKVLKGKLKKDAPIGAYKFTECVGDIVRIGCHTISLSHAVQVLTGKE